MCHVTSASNEWFEACLNEYVYEKPPDRPILASSRRFIKRLRCVTPIRWRYVPRSGGVGWWPVMAPPSVSELSWQPFFNRPWMFLQGGATPLMVIIFWRHIPWLVVIIPVFRYFRSLFWVQPMTFLNYWGYFSHRFAFFRPLHQTTLILMNFLSRA